MLYYLTVLSLSQSLTIPLPYQPIATPQHCLLYHCLTLTVPAVPLTPCLTFLKFHSPNLPLPYLLAHSPLHTTASLSASSLPHCLNGPQLTVLLSHELPHCPTASMSHSLIGPLPHCPIASMSHSLIGPLPHCPTALMFHNFTVQLPQFLTAYLSH
jgi:hypothetical protein